MNIEIDTHTHTLASGHAYSTLKEMAAMAANKGLKGLAVTEHAPEMPGTCHLFYFQNLKVVPRKMEGVELLLGAELNIMDESGAVDLPEKLIADLDISIASIHTPCYGISKGIQKNTEAYLNAMRKGYIDIIGHPDDGRFEVDYAVVVKEAKETGTLLEINNSSLRPGGFRIQAYDNDISILKYCMEYGAMITLGSDAHVDVEIKEYSYIDKLMEEVGFPEELVANTSVEKLKSVMKRYNNQKK